MVFNLSTIKVCKFEKNDRCVPCLRFKTQGVAIANYALII